MKRRIALGFALVLVIAAIGFFGIAPGLVDRSMNQVEEVAIADNDPASDPSHATAASDIDRDLNRVAGPSLPPVSQEARNLHASLTIVDLHADTLMWGRSLLDDVDWGHVDLRRLQQGNVALQVFSSVTKTPAGQNYDGNGSDTDRITPLVIAQMQPVRTWTSLLERSRYHAEKLDDVADRSNGAVAFVRDAADLNDLIEARQGEQPPVGGLFSVEGLHNLKGDLENIEVLYRSGMRMAGLTHFFDNEIAGSAHGLEKGGLTTLGRSAIARMEELGIIVDIAHCSDACIAEVIAMARRPIVSSHGGVEGTCPGNRNLSDQQIRGVAATGGIIGIGYWAGAVCDTSPAAVAKAMKYVRDLVGIEHIALGSDFDGAVTVRFDTSRLAHVTQALMEAGFSEAEIRAVMGENALRVIGQGIVPLARFERDPAEETG